MKKSLADFNLFYALFFPVVQYATRCHYRHVAVRGRENLPVGGNYILAPCHQNAMMDPLVVLMVVNKPVVFLARADIFKNPVARFFLTWLRISPVYRILEPMLPNCSFFIIKALLKANDLFCLQE